MILYVNLVKLSIGSFVPYIEFHISLGFLCFEPNKSIVDVHVSTGRLPVGGR